MSDWQSDETIVPGGPGWWSGNSSIEVADGQVRKTPRVHVSQISHPESQLVLRTAVADAGLGPAVTPQVDGLVMPDLRHDGYGVATYGRLRRIPGSMEKLIDAHRMVSRLPVTLPVLDVFAEIARLRGVVAGLQIAPPSSAAPVEYFVADVRALLDDGPAPVPSFGDATSGNAMVREDGSVALVGGTLASAVDPHYTAGVVIAEFAPHLAPAEEVFERFWGTWDTGSFARAQFYSIVDDLRWSYISRIATAHNEDPSFVASLYGQFRTTRARATLKDSRIQEWRRIA